MFLRPRRRFGRADSIENHYQRAKRFGELAPADWREAKRLKGLARQTAWQIGPLRVDVRPNEQGNGFALHDLGIQYYVMLWYRYLRQNPELLAVAAKFDEFEDPFKGSFPFCQVIETYGHLMPENLADAVSMIDRKLGRDEPAPPPLADEVAAMRAEIQRLREELQLAKAA